MNNAPKLCVDKTQWFQQIRLSLCLGLVVLGSASVPAENVILFIGDGMGYQQVLAARCFNGGPLSFEGFPNQASCTTHSANSAITDSAAAATAIATAQKVNNGVLSLAVPGDGWELETLLEFYQERGKKVGLITTTYLTHATPAAFGAHTTSRNNTAEIGSDLLTQSRPNVLFGGGGYGLESTSAAAMGYLVATDTLGFNLLDTTADQLAALFGSGYMPYEYDYFGGVYPYPHLAEMVQKALAALQNGPNGFFLMVEGGMIDQACHANHLARSIDETLAFSWAVQAALSWAGNRLDTTIVVTADHETGGLTVTADRGQGNYPSVNWSTTGHTAAHVPVYAWGRNATFVQGTLDNTDFFNLVTAENTSSPVLARVCATVVDATSVLITWATDVQSSSSVEYGLSPSNYASIATDNALVAEHSILLSGLTTGQRYYYRVTSADSGAQGTSAEYSFTPISLLDPGLLIPAGSVWRYHDTGADLGTSWRDLAYDDSTWKSGPAQLGYGDGDEKTVIASSPVRPCYYFRHSFAIDHAAAYANLSLSILRDDGAVVYLNGTEIARYNMPSGSISYGTWASTASEYYWDPVITLPDHLLVDGVNVLAVEVHQGLSTSTDVSMDLKLTATRLNLDTTPPVISAVTVSGVTENSAVLTWTTDEPADSLVQYGLSEDFGLETGSTALVTSHRVELIGLGANTTYHYVTRSTDVQGNAAFGTEGSFNTLIGSPPSAPSGLTASAQSSTTILLTWTDTSMNETGFEVWQSVDGSQFSKVGTITSDLTSALVTDLSPATFYSFFVRAFNGASFSDSALASATTLNRPLAYDQSISTLEDQVVSITLTASDADGDSLSFTIGTPPLHGTLGPVAGNQVNYTPNRDYSGSDSFTFLAYDGKEYSLPATLTVTLAPVNDTPIANPDATTTLQGVAITLDVLVNDLDADGDELSVVAVTQGANGSVTFDANGAVTYQPKAGFTGQDTFTYTASDLATTAVGSVTVTVNPNILFHDGFESGNFTAGGWTTSGTAAVDTAARFAGLYGALLKKTSVITKSLYAVGTSNVRLEYKRRVAGLESGEFGWVEMSSDGQNWVLLEQVSGTAAWESMSFPLSLNAPDLQVRFRLNCNDGNDMFMVDEVVLTGGVSGNRAPTAMADAYSTTEDGLLTVTGPGLLGNDRDPDADPLTALLENGPVNGTLVLRADGSFSYAPNTDFNGTDTFAYKASDGTVESTPVTVTILVTPVNDAPIANFTHNMDGLRVTFADASSDGDGSITGWAWSFGDGGTSSAPGPAHDYGTPGTYTVSLTVTDNGGATANVTMEITVKSAGAKVSVEKISYSTAGGKSGNNHLVVRVSLKDGANSPVANASVSVLITNATQSLARTGTTDSSGIAVFQWNAAPSGTYQTKVENVLAAGLTWDGVIPENSYTK